MFKIVTANMIMKAPINSMKPKLMFKNIMDKIIDENGSSEAKTLIFVGERYFVLSRYAQKAIAVPKMIMAEKEIAVSKSKIPVNSQNG